MLEIPMKGIRREIEDGQTDRIFLVKRSSTPYALLDGKIHLITYHRFRYKLSTSTGTNMLGRIRDRNCFGTWSYECRICPSLTIIWQKRNGNEFGRKKNIHPNIIPESEHNHDILPRNLDILLFHMLTCHLVNPGRQTSPLNLSLTSINSKASNRILAI